MVVMWLLCGYYVAIYSGILNCLAAMFVLLGSVAGCNGVETGFLQSLDGGFFYRTGMGDCMGWDLGVLDAMKTGYRGRRVTVGGVQGPV